MRLSLIILILVIGFVALVFYWTPEGRDIGETQGVPAVLEPIAADSRSEEPTPVENPDSWSVELVVTDDDDRPVEGASAVDWLVEIDYGVTSAQGELTIRSEQDLLVVAVSASGFACEVHVFEKGQVSEPVRCTLHRLATIEVVVDCEFLSESQQEIEISLVPTEDSGVISVDLAGARFRSSVEQLRQDASAEVSILEVVDRALQQIDPDQFIVAVAPTAVLPIQDDGVVRFSNLPYDRAYRCQVLSDAPFEYQPPHEVQAASVNPSGPGLIVDSRIHDTPVKNASGPIFVASGDIAAARVVCQPTATISGAVVFPSEYSGPTNVILKSFEWVDVNNDGQRDFGQQLIEAMALEDEDGVFAFSNIRAQEQKIIIADSTRRRSDGSEEIWFLWKGFRAFQGENRLGDLYPLNVPPIRVVVEYVDASGNPLPDQQFDPPLPERLAAHLLVDIDSRTDKKDLQGAEFEMRVGVETLLYGLPVERRGLSVHKKPGTFGSFGNRTYFTGGRVELSDGDNRILIPVQRIERGTIPVNVVGGLLTLHTRPLVDSPLIPGGEHKSRSIRIPDGPRRTVEVPMRLTVGDFSLLVISAEAGEWASIPSTNLDQLTSSAPIQLSPGNTLEVIVSTATGTPVPGYYVEVGIEGWDALWYSTTNERGIITFEGVLPAVELWLGKEKRKLFSGEPGAYIQTEVTIP
ncbi:MAG: hypothetical protein CMJ95_03615 [Planctomycetes bacterium]|nr:hypothetical protein [Planctomycetota bacterium]